MQDYVIFYAAYSEKLKFGFIHDAENKGDLAQLLRYRSTMSGEEMTSLKDYVTRMKEGESNIFFNITGGNIEEVAENSPIIGWLKSNGHEVLYLEGTTDWYVDGLLVDVFKGKKLVRAIE